MLSLASAIVLVSPVSPEAVSQQSGGFDHTHAPLTEVLAEHVRDGRVDYAALKRSPAPLDRYLAQLAAVTPADHEKWTREERYAFWINAYNAWTLQLVRDAYPIKSIKDLGSLFTSPWEKHFIPLGAFDPEGKGRELTLDEIEHELVRPVFKDARVHAAVNCASISCPPLRAEAYAAPKLEEQLDEQVALWLADRTRNEVLPERGRIRVSKIFDWYERDFGRSDAEVARWIADHLADEEQARRLRASARDLKVRYLDYDWGLNVVERTRAGR